MQRIPTLYIAPTPLRGRGVFSTEQIHEGDVIEVCPILLIDAVELPVVHKTMLHDYYFLWGEEQNQGAIALGYGSIYNHITHSNTDFTFDYEAETITFFAVKDIAPGEEITINYLGETGEEGDIWFEIN
jgi:uncharacterized protein